MKSPGVFLLLTGGMLAVAPAATHPAWQWEQAVQVPAAGMVRLDLPPPTLNASRPDLADLRLLSPTGVETPYLMEVPESAAPREMKAVDFKATLVEPAPATAAATVLEVGTGTGEPIAAVTLETPAREFIKSVTIEGRREGTDWQALATREVIFRQAGGAERLRLPLPAVGWQRLRFTVSDARSGPVAFTGVGILLADSRKPETVGHPVGLDPVMESSGTTKLGMALLVANLHLADLKLEVTDPVFSRHYSLGVIENSADDPPAIKPLAEGTLYRVLGEQGSSAEQLVIPIHQRIPGRQLRLTLQNGDSPPLSITSASARRYPTTLAYYAPQPGTWKLLTGNSMAETPRYDLAPLRGELTKADGQRLSPGPLQAKADFQVPPALPGVDPAGASIDLTEWGFRRAVQAPATGVIRIELDPPALAHSNTSLSDLRLVQDGRQLPYLLESDPILRTIQPASAAHADPQRPNVSRWQLTLPLDNLPVTDLLADSASPLFTRTFVATAERKDSLGNAWTQTLGTATWTRTASPGGQPNSLMLGLANTRLPATFWLETANGDNPPITVDNIRIRYAAPLLAAKLVSAAPLFLYYGNPEASTPAYDLRLVRAELLAADKLSATLAAEETLRPERRRNDEVSPGSPWLWAALALVVVVLLVVVARMLPKPVA
ncbi:MAG: hypothetical protein NTW21_21505 [Verrucomicrobia bacterium]|nr:hypothetical protein [Verrucomicrobiota bacterium]